MAESTSPTPSETFADVYRQPQAMDSLSYIYDCSDDDDGGIPIPGSSGGSSSTRSSPSISPCTPPDIHSQMEKAVSPTHSSSLAHILCSLEGFFSSSEKKKVKMSFKSYLGAIMAAPAPLKYFAKVIYILHSLPRNPEVIASPRTVPANEILVLSDLVPKLGFENINTGSQKVIDLFEESSRDEKMLFLRLVIEYLITMGESGPCLSEIEGSPLTDVIKVEQDKTYTDTELVIEKCDVDVKDALKRIRIINLVDKIRQIMNCKIFIQYNQYYTDRRRDPFSDNQVSTMKEKSDELNLALIKFSKPIFDKYYLETFRLVASNTLRPKDRKRFRVSVNNQFRGQMLGTPLTQRVVCLKYSYCIAWGIMFLKMSEVSDDEAATAKSKEEEEKDCSICTETYKWKAFAVLDICDHEFCTKCIKMIFTSSEGSQPMCPHCRAPFESWTTRARFFAIRQTLKEADAMTGRMKLLDATRVLRAERRGVPTSDEVCLGTGASASASGSASGSTSTSVSASSSRASCSDPSAEQLE